MPRAASMAPIARAGFAYFAIVFAVGFLLGTLRTLILTPRIGPLAAVLVEAPLMLALAFVACRWLLVRYRIGPAAGSRLAMGGLALVLLVGAELLLAVAAFGSTPADFLLAYATPPGAVGLAAQLVFAAMPLLFRGRPGR